MRDWLSTFLGVRTGVQKRFGLQGEFPGKVLPGIQPVSLADSILDQSSLYLKGGSSWEASCFMAPSGGGDPGVVMLRPGLTGDLTLLKKVRVTSIAAWSLSASPSVIAWSVRGGGVFPVLAGSVSVRPFSRDTRQLNSTGVSQRSFYFLNAGNHASGGAPTNADGWARLPAPVVAGGAGQTAPRIDPGITLLFGDYLWVTTDNGFTGFNVGLSIAWEEIPISEQEADRVTDF